MYFSQLQKYLIDGPIGKLEVAFDMPQIINSIIENKELSYRFLPIGLAFIAHPHPLFHGNMDNKVIKILSNFFVQSGYLAIRLNFRGVGKSEGKYDGGYGEQNDFLSLVNYTRNIPHYSNLPFILAGFSFGAFIVSNVSKKLNLNNIDLFKGIILIGTPAKRWQIPYVNPNTLIIHGEQDKIIPLKDVLDWACPQQLPVIVIPGSEHFFHGKLLILRQVLFNNFCLLFR